MIYVKKKISISQNRHSGISIMECRTPWLVLGPHGVSYEKKVGTLIDEEVIKLAKQRALEEGRPLSDVIQDAIVTYLITECLIPKSGRAPTNFFVNVLCASVKTNSGKSWKKIAGIHEPRRYFQRQPLCYRY